MAAIYKQVLKTSEKILKIKMKFKKWANEIKIKFMKEI